MASETQRNSSPNKRSRLEFENVRIEQHEDSSAPAPDEGTWSQSKTSLLS